jgi:hypothetical protein
MRPLSPGLIPMCGAFALVALLFPPLRGQSLPPAQSSPDSGATSALLAANDTGASEDFAATPGSAAAVEVAAASTGTQGGDVTVSANGLPPTTAGPQPLPESTLVINGGRLPFQLGLALGGYYDDNIYIQPSGPQRVGDFIWTVSPSIGWNSAAQTGADNAIQIAYAPTFVFYQTHVDNNTIDQAGNFIYGYNNGKTNLVVSEVASSAQETAIDYGNLVNETTSITTLNLIEQFSGKMSGNLILIQDLTQDDPGLRSSEWTAEAYLDYQAAPKTSVGLGVVGGYAELEGPNQTYEQINGRVSWDPTVKLSFSLTAGGEFRETEGLGGASFTPDFTLGLSYQPFDSTNLGLNAYRRYDYSGRFYGEDYLATGVSASWTQRFLQKFYVTVSSAFEDAMYQDNLSGAFANQSYDYVSARAGLAYRPTSWCELGIFYQYRQNFAEGQSLNFTDDQAGFTARFTY